jgi:uncharacterized membrane protein YeaQ/YmgE (transglycosylase-associated protein family)
VLGFLIAVLVIGIIAGYLARLLVVGPDPMGFWQTVLLGVVGSLIGGTVGSLLFTGELRIGLGSVIVAIPGAVVALLIYRKAKYGTIMPPRP